jgi:phytoene synthase
MDTIERLHVPITSGGSWNTTIGVLDYKANAAALRPADAGSSFSWAIGLLPAQRRQALRALCAFCREVDDIADGEASNALKETLLGSWRGEVAHLYGGRPRNAVTLGLSQAVHLYRLRYQDFLAIIDGAEMKAQTGIRAPSFAQLDRYCERGAVAVARLSVRIFGDETPAGERVAAELGRALQLTNILHNLAEDAKQHRLYLPRELLHAREIFATTPSWVLAQPALADVCRDLATVAERHYAAAVGAIAACPRWTMRPVAVMLGIHHALLHQLLVRGWRHIDEPVRIPAWHKFALVIRLGLTGRCGPVVGVETASPRTRTANHEVRSATEIDRAPPLGNPQSGADLGGRHGPPVEPLNHGGRSIQHLEDWIPENPDRHCLSTANCHLHCPKLGT